MYPKKKIQTLILINIKNGEVPAAAIPEATPRASKAPMATNRDLGRPIISSVTIPERYRANNIEKYIIT